MPLTAPKLLAPKTLRRISLVMFSAENKFSVMRCANAETLGSTVFTGLKLVSLENF